MWTLGVAEGRCGAKPTNIKTSTKTKADDLNSFDSVQCIYEAKPKHSVQCLSPIISTAHVTSFIFITSDWLYGGNHAASHGHMWLSTYGLHVTISSYELMTKPRCCLNDSEISEFMSPRSNSGAQSFSCST